MLFFGWRDSVDILLQYGGNKQKSGILKKNMVQFYKKLWS